jgi:hypothetical protein
MVMSQQELSSDIVLIKDILLRLNDNQQSMSETLSEIQSNLDRLQHRILGDPTYNQKGLIEEVQEIKKYINNDKVTKNRVYGGLVAVAFFWTIVWEFIKSKFR